MLPPSTAACAGCVASASPCERFRGSLCMSIGVIIHINHTLSIGCVQCHLCPVSPLSCRVTQCHLCPAVSPLSCRVTSVLPLSIGCVQCHLCPAPCLRLR